MSKSYRILHVDDDPLMGEVVDLALGLDPHLTNLTCGSAREALAAVKDWELDLILCDVMMPEMDGPAFLKSLRADPATAGFPLIFMSARMAADEAAALKALGAVAVIAKPFVPEKLAETVRRHLATIQLNAAGFDFTQRLRRDAETLAAFRNLLQDSVPPEELQSFVHKLAGAAGIFNFAGVSERASVLETSIIDARAGRGRPEHVASHLDALLECMPRA